MSSLALPVASLRSILIAAVSAAVLPIGAGNSMVAPLRLDSSVHVAPSARDSAVN